MTFDAVIIGGGIGGLNVAYQMAKKGMRPLLIEARGRCGGLIAAAPVAGHVIDIGAESYARRSTYCAQLCEELRLDIRQPGGSSWVWSADDRVFPLPYGLLGIPADLDDPDVATALGTEGLARAKQDLTMGPIPGAESADLASLVRTRLGEQAYQTLVRPVAGGIYSAEPEALTSDVVIPGLRATLAETGSLVLAAAKLRAAAPPGAVVSSVVGGLYRLPAALVAAIEERGGEVRTKTIVTSIQAQGDAWVVRCAPALRGPTPASPPVPGDDTVEIVAPRVVVAVDGRAGMELLRPIEALEMGDWTLPAGAKVAHVVLALNHPDLDKAPRGSGLLVAPRTDSGVKIGAKALTHLSVKWPMPETPTHYLRVSYGRPGEDPHPDVSQGLRDAGTLLGVELSDSHLVGSMVVHWNDSLPPPTPAHRARVGAFTQRVASVPGLGVVGAWVAGNGLASVLQHADGEALRMMS